MSRPKTWPIPNDWTEEDGHLTVFFCIPNSPQWRKIIVGLISEIEYGRNWDETTGNIKETQVIANQILEGLQMLCNDELERIAVALESIDNKTPPLISLADFITSIQNAAPGIELQELEALLNILGLLPGIDLKFDPVRMTLDWIWRSQILAIGYSMSTSQVAMAAALAKGLAVDGIDTILDGIGDGSGLLADILGGTGNVLAGITGLIQLFQGQDAPDLRVLQDINIAIQNNAPDVTVNLPAMQVTNNVECSNCGSSSGLCGCPDIDGPTQSAPAQQVDPCGLPPEELGSWEEYTCEAAHWMHDTVIEALAQLSLISSHFFQEARNSISGNDNSTSLIYQKAAQALSTIIPQYMWFNLTNTERTGLITDVSNRLFAYFDDVALRVPETDTLDDVTLDWWQPFKDAAEYLVTNRDAQITSIFALTGTDDVLAEIETQLTNAFLAAVGEQVNAAEGIAKSLITSGFAAAKVLVLPQVVGYPTDIPCVPDWQCCYDIFLVAGVDNGNGNYSSVSAGGFHHIDFWIGVDNQLQSCASLETAEFTNLTGWVSLGDGTSYLIDTSYSSDTQPVFQGDCGKHWRIRSFAPFSVDIEVSNCV